MRRIFLLPVICFFLTYPVAVMPQSLTGCANWEIGKIIKFSDGYKAIKRYSQHYNIDDNLVKAIITAESCFKANALSSAGAAGLMQLMPATAKRFGIKNRWQPDQNILGGIRYLSFLKKFFKGDLNKIIAAYNAGEGAVMKYKGVPPYKETRQYLKNVFFILKKLKDESPERRLYPPSKVNNKPINKSFENKFNLIDGFVRFKVEPIKLKREAF